MKYDARTGGRPPKQLEAWLEAYVEAGFKLPEATREEMISYISSRRLRLRGTFESWLLGRFWNVGDVMPASLRDLLKKAGAKDKDVVSFAKGVRFISEATEKGGKKMKTKQQKEADHVMAQFEINLKKLFELNPDVARAYVKDLLERTQKRS